MFKRLAMNTVVQVLGKAITVLVSLVTTGILTRKLGSLVYGQYILITSLSLLFDSLADFGTSIIGVREAAKKSEEKERIKIWSNVAILRLIMALISLVLGVVFVYSWPDFKELRIEALLAWSMLIFTSLAGSLAVVWQTRIKMEVKVLVEVAFPVVFLGCLWCFGSNISLIWIFGMYLVARVVTLAWGWWLARGSINFRLIDKKLIGNLVKMSWPMGIYLLVFTAYDRSIDSLMIGRMLGPDEVAWYGLAYKIYGVLIQPAYFLMNGVFPMLSARNDGRKLFRWSGLVLFLSGVTLMLGMWLLAPFTISVLAGSQFMASVGVLRILAVALVFSYLGHLVGFTLISKEGQKEMLAFGITSLVFNFLGNLVAIPFFGIYGAAGVTVLTEALSLLLMSLRLRRRK
ncbi:oligosaccharide flippase family protein [Patescibacteria group bacterium]|nr:oligosaccharide flippase family protein [Patescibacteria group bacterium]